MLNRTRAQVRAGNNPNARRREEDPDVRIFLFGVLLTFRYVALMLSFGSMFGHDVCRLKKKID